MFCHIFVNAAVGAVVTLMLIFAATILGTWWLANRICDYLERGRIPLPDVQQPTTSQQGVTRVSDWPGVGEAAPYVWTGGAGIVGRLMFHAKQVQQGKRKPLSWALLFDLPIALAMGWIVYGLCVWFRLEPQPTISAAIAASYLGPYSVDRLFTAWAAKVGEKPA